jgi:Plasmid pRiA4b ORF-3-like protein
VVKTTRLQVVLAEVVPPAVRVIDVPSSSSLPELHHLLQAAMGWTDSHLHQFLTTGNVSYGSVRPDDLDIWPDQRDETQARLTDLGAWFTYLYDFGDNWTHEVSVLGPGDTAPGCVDGQGSCPPEDVGGPPGYTELLDALADPDPEDHQQMRDWTAHRLRPFDRAGTDRYIRQVIGQVPDTVRLLLELTAGGVRLPPGGRLPRTVVHGMQQQRPHWHLSDRPAASEDDLWPLASLHQHLRTGGLLRIRHGILTPTKAATGDDLTIVRRLRAGFDPRTFTTVLTTQIVAALAGHGPHTPTQLATWLFPLLQHGWATRDGQPVTERDITVSINHQAPLLEGLDLIDTSTPAWTAGPSARTLLPAATLLAEIWSTHDHT